MPKLNKPLVMSIVTDIKECVHVTNEIYSWVGEIEHLSWKFPTKTAKSINAMEIVEEHKGTAGEFYILLLELAYDRIQFFLRLVVEFLDKYTPVEDFSKDVARVKRPNQMSLASTLRLIWNRLTVFPEFISRSTVKCNELKSEERNPNTISRSSQASSALIYCESCSMASKTILRLINVIEDTFQENKLISTAAAERKHSRDDDIYERTQWALMSRLTDAIGTDVKTVLTSMREVERKGLTTKQDYEKKIHDLRVEVSWRNQEMDRLETKNVELEETLENAKKRLEATVRDNFTTEQENRTLYRRLKDMSQQLVFLADGSNILQSQVGLLAESKLELENIVSRLKREVAESRDAGTETERNFRLLLTELKSENDLVKSEYEKRIEALQGEISTISVPSRRKEKSDRRSNRNEGLEEKEEDKEESVLMPGDDPEVDMTRELMSNREKIEVLLRQNDRLSKTLSRLRKYRLTVQTTTNGLDK